MLPKAACRMTRLLLDLGEHPLLLIFRQRRPDFTADDAGQARDDEIGPAIALAFEQELGNRDT